jgi:O-antigen ligase
VTAPATRVRASVTSRLPGAGVGLVALLIATAVVLGLVAARLPMFLGLAVIGAIAFGVVAVLRPQLLVPVAAAVMLMPVVAVPVVGSSSDAIVLALALVWAIGALVGQWRVHRGHLVLLAFAAWMVAGYVLHPHGNSLVSAASDLRSLLSCLVFAAICMSMPIAMTWLLRSVATVTVVLSVITITTPRILTGALGTSERAVAFGLNSNYLGQELAFCIIACVALALLWHERWAIAVAVLAGVALLATESRGALFALLATGALLIWGRASTTARVVLIAGAALFLAFGPSVGTATSTLLSRDSQELDIHNEARADAAITAGRYLITHPLTGVGYGEFANVAYADPTFGTYVATHDDWLRVGAETGVLGLVLLAALLLPPLWVRGGGRTMLTMRALLLCGCIGLLFGNFLSPISVSALMWVAVGVLWAERERRRSLAPERSDERVPAARDAVERDGEGRSAWLTSRSS